ncbi:MAG: metallophosphoesterase family protein [Collinsella sp.]|nr:metallophosphoesterase family protein [Collinsella sp.]
MIWFTSDTHFGHANIIGFCNRPWRSTEEMDDALIDAINDRVAPRDTLYHLGDFSFKMTVEAARELRGKIRCQDIHRIPGNHDNDWSRPGVEGTFQVEMPIATLKVKGGRKVVMCHYPLMDWPGLGYGAIHLHGHIHASRTYNEWNRSEHLLRYDVGVDANGYAPVSLDEILEFFSGVGHLPYVRDDGWARSLRAPR